MNVASVMDELATQLDTIAGLRVSAFIPKTVTPPQAIVGFPEVYTYDIALGRGSDSMTIPIYVLVGAVSDRTARDRLAAFMDGSGASSFKAVLRAGTYTAFSTQRIKQVVTDAFVMNGVEYLGAMFSVDITGPGT